MPFLSVDSAENVSVNLPIYFTSKLLDEIDAEVGVQSVVTSDQPS